MKLKQLKLAVRLKRRKVLDLELVVLRQYFSLIDENGNDLSSHCHSEVKYCIRKRGASKVVKCFHTLDEAKKYLNDIIEASRENKSQPPGSLAGGEN